MRLIKQVLLLAFNYCVRRLSRGACVRIFCQNMGITYIKMGQILAMQNYGNYFTEEDRQDLLSICNDVNPIVFDEIEKTLYLEYGESLYKLFPWIDKEPTGSASVSQVHRAITYDGRSVVLKIKRKDIDKTIKQDIADIKRCLKLFGWLTPLNNAIGSQTALNYYMEWIFEEIDFQHEMYNIERYRVFADSVNGRVEDCKNIVIPKLYTDLCRDDVIVMEYIKYPILNKLNDASIITQSVNTYVKLSFYNFFHDRLIVFHGDPHAGNLYVTDNGDVGFLDMGLVFELSDEDTRLTKALFMSAFFQNYDRLMMLLKPWLSGDEKEQERFGAAIKKYLQEIPNKPITYYFTDVVYICTEVKIAPPRFLFCMAKAFVCLNGMDSVYFNSTSGRELIGAQVMEYLIDSGEVCLKTLLQNGSGILVSLLNNDTHGIATNLVNSIETVMGYFKYLA